MKIIMHGDYIATERLNEEQHKLAEYYNLVTHNRPTTTLIRGTKKQLFKFIRHISKLETLELGPHVSFTYRG